MRKSIEGIEYSSKVNLDAGIRKLLIGIETTYFPAMKRQHIDTTRNS